jgi:hypothetical protein
LLVFIILQKLPVSIKTAFEERYGKDPEHLPTIKQLVELLEDQCRVQRVVASPEAERRTPGRRRSPPHQGRAGQATLRPPQPVRVLAAEPGPSNQVTSVYNHCSYCGNQSHSLYKCSEFLRMTRSDRRSWARKSGHCFKCLRKHYARECTQRNWCNQCGTDAHNSLLCNADTTGHQRTPEAAVQRADAAQRASARAAPPGRLTPSPRPARQVWATQPAHTSRTGIVGEQVEGSAAAAPRPSPPTPLAQVIQSGHITRPRIGDRARLAQETFNSLRFGSRTSPEPHL